MKKLLLFLALAAAGLQGWADEYYLVGGCTDSGWNAGEWQRSAVRAYTADGTTWVWAGKLTTGEGDAGRFKIPNGTSEWHAGYWAPSQGTVLTSEWSGMDDNGDSNDYKWCVSEEGYYLITFKTDTKQIKAEKLTAPSKDGDYYLINSVSDYYYFAAYIATDDTKNAKARLTADLNFSEYTFTPMASDKHKFKGEFDGNGHTIDYAVVQASSYGKVGLFTYLADGANVHDLIMGPNCSFTATVKVGGIAGYARDGGTVTLTNVINKAAAVSTGGENLNEGNSAGFIACATDNTIITATNCANMGLVSGQDGQCAAFAGWTQDSGGDSPTKSTFTNCWNSGTIYNTEGTAQLYRNSGKVTATNCYDASASTSRGQGTLVDASTVSSGILGIKLNLLKTSGGDWYQTVGTDNNPVPFSVSPHAVHTAISVTPADGWYEISQPCQLRWMAEAVNEKNSTYGSANIKLTANIDYSAYTDQAAMIGKPSNVFAGTFDGQNHTVTVGFNNTTDEETGLFRRINNGTVRNLKVDGTITTTQKLAGGICSGIWDRGTIENCESAVTINDSGSGDATHGGILAAVRGTNDAYTINIQNCLFSGTLNASSRTGSAGIVGWTSNSNTLKVKNCLVTGTLTIADSGDNGVIVRSTCDGENNYYTCSAGSNLNKDYATEAGDEKGTGELCYLLNGQVSGGTNWRQTIGTDAAPTPFNTSSVVYANGSFQCDGVTPTGTVTYANTENHTVANHSFDTTTHLCTECKAVGQEPGTSEGAYQIGSIGHLVWFASHVNAGNTTANGVLTADIAQGDAKYVPIGTEDNIYVGRFDGQGHTVDLALNNTDKDFQGLFGVVTDGVFIEKLVVTGYVNGHNYVGGIVGGTKGSNSGQKTNIWYCGNEAAINAANANGAGIIGVNMGGAASVIVTNCYNSGDITGTKELGAISGWLGDGKSSARNCYNSGTVQNPAKGFCRNGGSYFTNCYYTASSGTDNSTEDTSHGQPAEVADDAVGSGLLCAKLGYGFRQNLGEGGDAKPNFDVDHGFVTQIGDARYSTMYNIHSDVTIPDGVEAYAGVVNTTAGTISLNAITGKVAKDEPVVLKLADGTSAGLFNFMPTSGASNAATNDLKGSSGNTTGGDNIYALAKKGDDVGFYLVGSSVTIPEGRAYLEYTAPTSVKGFTFVFDDDATGIENLNVNDNLNEGAIYNLAGQRLGKMQKGINIVNGRKVLK